MGGFGSRVLTAQTFVDLLLLLLHHFGPLIVKAPQGIPRRGRAQVRSDGVIMVASLHAIDRPNKCVSRAGAGLARDHHLQTCVGGIPNA